MVLFPLYSACGLGGEVVEDAVDAIYLCGDSCCDCVEVGVGDFLNCCGHSVCCVDSADDCGPALVALAVSYADTLHIGYGDEVLPYVGGKTALIELFTKDCVCFTKCVESVACDCAKATNTKAGTREGLTVDHLCRKTECSADDTNFVFIKELNGFNKTEVKILGKTANVVVSLYALAFDDIGINCALCKEINIVCKLACFLSEEVNKLVTDNLSLCFGISYINELIEETVSSIDINEVCIESVPEKLDYVLALALTHKAMVYVNADKLLADCLDKESCDNRAVYTAGKSEKNLLVANLLTNESNLLIDKSVGKLCGSNASH